MFLFHPWRAPFAEGFIFKSELNRFRRDFRKEATTATLQPSESGVCFANKRDLALFVQPLPSRFSSLSPSHPTPFPVCLQHFYHSPAVNYTIVRGRFCLAERRRQTSHEPRALKFSSFSRCSTQHSGHRIICFSNETGMHKLDENVALSTDFRF